MNAIMCNAWEKHDALYLRRNILDCPQISTTCQTPYVPKEKHIPHPRRNPKPPLFIHKPPPPLQQELNMSKSSTIANRDAAKMAAYAPVEIGTRGTVGSLIMKEIEHFSRLE
ncbi:hypothetical protein ACE6H2_027414 [Prunus campanulata]